MDGVRVSRLVVHGGVRGVGEIGQLDLAGAVAAGRSRPRALEAVEAAVVWLEDNPKLNAGTGAALTADGTLELDAGIADGSTGRFGVVATVQVRNPIVLARRIMDVTPHALMVAEGAMALAGGLPRLSQPAREQLSRWEEARARGDLAPDRFGEPDFVDTVGAAAVDDAGRMAAGSSTGGVFGKLPGRVGDAPVFGAG